MVNQDRNSGVRKRGMRRIRHDKQAGRRGVSTLDLILTLAVALPMVGIVVTYGIRIIRAVYEMICAWVAWPFM